MNKFKLFAIMLILGACEQPPSAQPQQASQPQTAKITTNANCKNLHKVTDIDDLLYQMYTNIDGYCLFEMPTAELERIWGIRVYDYTLETEHGTPEQNKINIQKIDEMSAEILKLYASKKDYLFVEKSKWFNQENIIGLRVAAPFNNSGNITLGKFPKLLPSPTITKVPKSILPLHTSTRPSNFKAPANTVYIPTSEYYWLNSNQDKNKPILEISTGIDGIVSSPILFYSIYNFEKLNLSKQ